VKKSNEPQKTELSDQDIDRLEKNVFASNLSPQDQALLIKVLKWSRWVFMLLKRKEHSLKALRRLIFGPKTEKLPPKSDADKQKQDKDKPDPSDDPAASSGEKKKKGNHGRNGVDKHSGAERVFHSHETLCPEDSCPKCSRGTLYDYKISSFMNFTGRPPIQAVRHDFQVLRCGTCQEIFWPKASEKLRARKWSESVSVALAMMHYWMGVPFCRIERLQKLRAVPLPTSTQWDLVERLARPCMYVYKALMKYGADAPLMYNDDTGARILSVKALRKIKPKEKGDRWGTFTTALVGLRDGHKVSLFMTGRRHAGENLKVVLALRDKDLGKIMTMNDAASRAMPKDLEAEICNCLSHGRRNFHDLLEDCPREAGHVIKLISKVYRADAQAKDRGMDKYERLEHMRRKCSKVMRKLWRWCHKQLGRKRVEPNSALGMAMRYLLKNWQRLMKFMTVPGAPVDNNICERLVKVMIRYRKNSLFFKTEDGALVGDILMSLIQTSLEAGVDAFHYLEAILKNQQAAKAAPENWFPWNYTANLAGTEA